MSVLLINPSGGYHHEYPPLGLLSLAAFLRESNIPVAFFDEGTLAEPGEEYLEVLRRHQPRYVGLSLYTTNIDRAYRLIAAIRAESPTCTVIVGGHHATALPFETLQECPEIDYLVAGEGEITLKELIESLERGADGTEVKGLFINRRKVRQPDQYTGAREYIRNLDELPLPAHDLADLDAYQQNLIRLGRRVGAVITSRGCPYSCTFCNKAVFQSITRRRSVAGIIREILCLRDRFGVDEIYFQDDLFALDRKWLHELLAALRAEGITLPWRMLARVDILRESDYRALREAGCYLVQFGVESGDDAILRDIHKGITTAQVREAFQMARQSGLQTYGFFIFGHRLDTEVTIRATLDLAKEIRADFTSFFLLVPFPGTGVYRYLPEEYQRDWRRIRYINWDRKLEPISLCQVPPRRLKMFEDQVNREYYGRPAYLLGNILSRPAPLRLLLLKLRWWLRGTAGLLLHLLCRRERVFASGVHSGGYPACTATEVRSGDD